MNSRIASVGSPSIALQQTIILNVIDFVFKNLSEWRNEEDHIKGKSISTVAEEILTADLHDYLEEQAHEQQELFYFHLEERQAGTRRIDLAVKPDKALRANLFQSDRRAITVFEAKRLPTPGAKREKEYVIGYDSNSGGIQRFKTCDHGADFETAAMIGYIQKRDPTYFHNTINSWIAELSKDKTSALQWTVLDQLEPLEDNTADHTARAVSRHGRMNHQSITLHHLWVVLGTSTS